jgi:CheY-like chemotaxis protein
MESEHGQSVQRNGQDSCERRPGILIADDMALILTLLKLELEPLGFVVWLAVDGDDAVDLYQKNHSKIDLVFLDVDMPGLDGPQTLEAIQQLSPEVLACFMTGGTGTYTEEELLDRGAALIFHKPFRPGDVAMMLQRLASLCTSSPVVVDFHAPSG